MGLAPSWWQIHKPKLQHAACDQHFLELSQAPESDTQASSGCHVSGILEISLYIKNTNRTLKGMLSSFGILMLLEEGLLVTYRFFRKTTKVQENKVR